jgi:hypothetical protein
MTRSLAMLVGLVLALGGACRRNVSLSTANETSHALLDAGSLPQTTQSTGRTPAASVTPAYPVAWWSGLELASASNARQRYAALDSDVFGELAHDETRSRPRSCEEWAGLHAHGYQLINTLEEQADSGAKLRCETLEVLERARPSTFSYVHNVTWDARMLALLPAIFATAINPRAENALRRASAANLTLAEYDPKARVRFTSEADTLEIIEGGATR